MRRAAVVLTLVAAAAAAPAQTPATFARDLHESEQHIAVSVQDFRGRSEMVRIPLTLFRPPGDGPFPLAVVAHGRGEIERSRETVRMRFETLARYLVGKGFAVIVPTRAGYGETVGDFDPEAGGGCATLKVEAIADAAADQVLAAVEHARTLRWIDASRWVVIGQSVGGLAALATAARAPAGLVAAINFAGGAGGNPDKRPGDPCAPRAVERLWRARAGLATVPTLWLYWRGDRYWGDELPRQWARAWAEGGGRISFNQLQAIGRDGHLGLAWDMDNWVPIVEPWLARLGFGRPGEVPRPPASGYAALHEVDKVPVPLPTREASYRRFLAAAPPRAFAVGPDGAFGWAEGDWARGRALGYCQRARGELCALYAVDDEVVWPFDDFEKRTSRVQEDPDRQPR